MGENVLLMAAKGRSYSDRVALCRRQEESLGSKRQELLLGEPQDSEPVNYSVPPTLRNMMLGRHCFVYIDE